MFIRKIIIAIASVFSCFAGFSSLQAPTYDVYASNEMTSEASVYDSSTRALFDSLSSESIDDLYIDDYYAGVYFSNLRENFGNNRYGSCSYVAIGMLLSFYDSYWDDSFIPEQYDISSQSEFIAPSDADFSFPSFYAESPGAAFEPTADVASLTLSEYESYVHRNVDEYFQCKLIALSETFLGSAKFEDSDNPYGMTLSEMVCFLEQYLHEYRNLSSGIAVVAYSDASTVRSRVIDRISDGIPVILRASSPTLGGHAFIAYDYDEDADEIYVHTGWRDEESGKTLSHVALSSTGFTSISDAVFLGISKTHSHSFNYQSESGEISCACNFVFPQDIALVSGNYRDENPTFEWKSLYEDKWYSSYDPYFDFSILDSSSSVVFEKNELLSRSYTLTDEEWDAVLYVKTSRNYYVYIQISSDSYSYWDEYYAKEAFKKPLEYNEIPTIKPSEYGFDDAYPTDDATKNDFISHTASQDFAFETRRYRTGYIHDEYIVMSPIRSGITEAYIEYRFSYAITRIDVELAHWRSTSHELLTASTGEASVQYYWEDGWVDKLDLLSSSTALPTDRNTHAFYKIVFDNPVYRVRFHAETTLSYAYENNRGRICIGDMAFYPSEYNLPLSGGELDYEPDEWNGSDRRRYNCYAYALNTKDHGRMAPGETENHNKDNTPNYFTAAVIEKMISIDAENYGFAFEKASKTSPCKKEKYKIAVVVDKKFPDIHFYRQNSDGTWSHKPSIYEVIKTDYQGSIIYDPMTADRRYSYDGKLANYNLWVGFYAVTEMGLSL